MDSLLKRDETQLKLLQDDAVFAPEEHDPRNPTFTAERLFLKNPDKYKLIIGLSGMGIGVKRISKLLSPMSVNTVLAVLEREPEKVETEKKRWGRLTRAASMLCLEVITERLSGDTSDESLKDLNISFGILTEKAELLMGGPTARIETREGKAVTHQDVLDYLHDLRSMGLKEEMGEQRAPAEANDGARNGAPEAIQAHPPAPAGDEKRPIKGLLPAVCEAPRAVGQTPHRSDDMPVNIDLKQGAQSCGKSISKADSVSA
jgi:hypothetical protein